jgi:flagellar P-ring protein precursor FlgI
MRIVISLLLCALLLPAATRLKDLVALEGVRENPLVGYGLVVGLNGTGDRRQTQFSAQSLTNMLQRMGVAVSPNAITVKNTAAVMVSGTLPPFAQPGTHVDVTISSIGDCSNLQGGLLVLTSLKGADGQVYAIAQGSVVTGGFVSGKTGNSQTVNHPTVGRIPEGAIVERPSPTPALNGPLRLQLRQMDFTTASRIAAAVNKKFEAAGAQIAKADNGAVVTVTPPAAFANRSAEFIAEMENVGVESDSQSKVVINERTGTIVIGKQVRILPAAIMHGNLSVEVQTSFNVSQPGPLAKGDTAVTPSVKVAATEEKARNVLLKEGATVEDLVRALSAIGSTPRDIIAILQSLRAARALEASLEVI